ncbi:MAG TPA: tRNA (guanosine(37)-N1)-methyltransferase TrmD, partial [Bryobacteraceae bacterium]
MIFHVLTIFPEFFEGPFAHGVVKRAQDSGLLEIRIHNLRDWAFDRHKTVDDRPFGGGEGMVLKPEPIFLAVESIWPQRAAGQKVILLSAQGRLFDQSAANRLSQEAELLLICGRYEGVDERVAERLADEELSIGNYVLSGGELAAAVVIDATARLLPGVLGNETSAAFDSFQDTGHGEG